MDIVIKNFRKAFTAALLAGGLLLAWQGNRLRTLREDIRRDRSGLSSTVAEGMVPEVSPRHPARHELTPMERVNRNLFQWVEPQEIADCLRWGDELIRAGLVLKWSEAEEKQTREAFTALDRERLKLYSDFSLTDRERASALREISAEKKTWLREHFDAERYAAWETSEAEFARNQATQAAGKALARLSKVMDLAPAQEDQLYAGFVELGLSQDAAPEEAPLALRPYGEVSTDPGVPDIDVEAQQILTAEQWQTHLANRKAGIQSLVQQQKTLSDKIIPHLFDALRGAVNDN